MSKTTLLLIVTLFASVAVHSVSSVAADSFTLTNGSFYKEKGSAKLVAAGDPSVAISTTASVNRQLIAGKNSKTNWYVYTTNTPSNNDTPNKAGATNIVFKKVDVNKLAFVDGSDNTVTVTGFKWGGKGARFSPGAVVGNNVTLLADLPADPTVDNVINNLYAYVIDLSKNEKTEVVIASGAYTSATDRTSADFAGGYTNGALTVILYSTSVRKEATITQTFFLVTLKGTTLGTPVQVKQFSYTGNTATEVIPESGSSGTGENFVVVFRTTAATTMLQTETAYPYTVTEKEIKAGATAPLNIQVEDSNGYIFESIHAHKDGRWVAVYSNTTGDGPLYTNNLVAKASNDTTGFKILLTYTDVTGTSYSYDPTTYFGGLVLFSTQRTASTGSGSPDQYTYAYQTFGGDLTTLGTKTTYLTISGTKYIHESLEVSRYRLGDNKAINLLVNQVAVDTTADPDTVASEGVYFGQLFQKSFGATLQSVLAVCSLTLAALFFF